MNIYKHLKLTRKENKNEYDDRYEKYDDRISKILEEANNELESYYSGSFKFDLDDDGITPDNLKLTPKKKRQIKEIWLKFDSKISEIKRKYEKFLEESKDNPPK